MSYLHTQEPAMTVVPGKHCETNSKISLKRSKKSNGGSAKAGVVSSDIQQNDGTSIEHLLAVLVPSIHNLAVEDDQGNKDSDLFKLFGDTLTGNAHNIFLDCLKQGNWDDSMKSQAGAFKKFLEMYLKKYTTSTNMKDTMFRYLEHGAKKPFDQSPGDFLMRFNLLYQSSQYFEGKKQCPPADELKDWYMSCYPKTYVLQYAKNKDYEAQDIEEITQYMQMLHQEDVNNGTIDKRKRELRVKKRNRDDDDSRSRRSGKSNRDARRRERRHDDRRDDRRSGNSNSRSGGGLRYNDPCPVHPTADHVWGKCRTNPRNKDKDDSSYNKRQKKDHDNKHHSHFQNDDDRSDEESFATASSGSGASASYSSHSYESDVSEEKPRRRKSSKKSKKKSKKKSSRSRSRDHGHAIQRKSSEESALSKDANDLFGDE